MLLCQILAYTIDGKILKSHTKTMNLKYPPPPPPITWNGQFQFPGGSYSL